MPRPTSPDLQTNWKICLPATLAGKVEFLLFDNLHNKPKYGARNKLIVALLEQWLSQQRIAGYEDAVVDVPTVQQLLETP